MIAEEYYDQVSRDEHLYQVRWSIDAETEPAPAHDGTQYFPEFLAPRPDEHFLDCGAYYGDTLEKFVELNPDMRGPDCTKHYTAIEPDIHNFRALEEHARGLDADVRAHLNLIHAAVCYRNRILPFRHNGNFMSRVDPSSDGTVLAIAIDFLAPHLVRPPTYIKMDIEGSELNALFGAIRTIQEHQPALAICTYHQLDHLWNIPVFLRTLCPDHHLFLRRYQAAHGESVCYAVPPDRLAEATPAENQHRYTTA